MPESEYPTVVVALLTGRCPRCREGSFFAHRPYDLKRFADFHQVCPHCRLRFEPEPGFFWGAMYINYAFVMGIFLSLLIGFSLWVKDYPLWLLMVIYLGIVLAVLPVLVRASRLLMLYLFAGHKFDPAARGSSSHSEPPSA